MSLGQCDLLGNLPVRALGERVTVTSQPEVRAKKSCGQVKLELINTGGLHLQRAAVSFRGRSSLTVANFRRH